MISLNKINLEYKSTALFGFTALLLSFLVGLLAGIRLNVVFLRSFILMVVFGAIGFGICIILKKYVPEVYEIVDLIAAMRGGGKEEGETAAVADRGAAPSGSDEFEAPEIGETGALTEPPAADFRELEKEGLSHFSTAPGGTAAVNTKSGKLGKHILESEKLAKYEPKIMAQAVRTMMSKDRE